MKIEEAIKVLSDNANEVRYHHRNKFKEAENLGIEALERLKAMREYPYLQNISLLPSETKLPSETEE